MTTRNLAVMFTDIKGFTARVSESGREDLTRLRGLHDRLLTPVFRHFEGIVVKTIGDAFLVRFDSPTDAVLCGLTVQEVLRRHNESASVKDRLEVRVAINAGEVELTDKDVFGETVNIAARLEGIAEAGEVYFTEAVYLSMNRREAPSSEVGERTFKGIPYPVRVYRATQEADTDFSHRLAAGVELTARGPVIHGLHRQDARPARGLRRGLVRVAAVSVAVLALAAVAFWIYHEGPEVRARREAREALDGGHHVRALDLLDPVLADRPGDAALRQMAHEAARAHVARLRDTMNASEALAWLRDALERRPYLEELRDLVPQLDAEVAAGKIRTADNPWPLVGELTRRYARDGEALYSAAVALEDMRLAPVPLELLDQARRLGAFEGRQERRRRLLSYAQRLFRHAVPGSDTGHRAHDLLAEAAPEETTSWARDALARETSGRVLENAWHALERTHDPLTADRHYAALLAMVDGFSDEAEADATLELFSGLTARARREQILAVHRWVLDPDTSWGGRHRKLVRRNLERLEQAWSD